MEKFAVVMQPDGGQRIVDSHPVLRRLPERIARKCLSYLPAQKTGVILDIDNNEDLGYLIDVPGFFSDWDKLEDEDRLKTIRGIVRLLERLDISALCFPLLFQYFTDDEILLLENKGITLLDGFLHILAGMLLVLKQLLSIVSRDVPRYETGIWGADTDVGQVWAEALAGDVNHMCIGGRDLRELERLADVILRTTGLSCQITDKPEVCLNNKNITILAEPVEIRFSRCRPSLHIHSIRGGPLLQTGKTGIAADMKGVYSIEMAWMASPHDLEIMQDLSPWEELGVLDGLFYAVSRIYRDDIRVRRITLDQIKRLHALYELYPVKLQGFIQKGRRIHFDRFRRDYFSDNRRRIVKIQ